ncbi:MAG TPA: hypothetical protein VL588_11330 [Bdellovibrionota bacterium]|nr:hypothetical protein [Bdellovibrionota bacterium]
MKVEAPTQKASDTPSAPVGEKPAEQKTPANSEDAEPEDEGNTDEPEDTKESKADEAHGDEESKDASDEKPKKKKGAWARRIDKLNGRISAAQQEAEYWKEQALKAPKPSGADASGAEKPTEPEGKPKAPKMADFETLEAYEAARDEYADKLTDWKIDQRDQARERKAQESKQTSEIQAHFDRMDAYSAEHADFAELVEDLQAQKARLSPTVDAIVIASENGPAILHELAKDPAEFKRINALGPLAAAREIGRLEAKLVSPTPSGQEPKKTTHAPKPITPVKPTGGKVEKSLYDTTLSFREYEALRSKKRA